MLKKHQDQHNLSKDCMQIKGERVGEWQYIPHNTLSCVGTRQGAGQWHCPSSWGEEVLPCLQKERERWGREIIVDYSASSQVNLVNTNTVNSGSLRKRSVHSTASLDWHYMYIITEAGGVVCIFLCPRVIISFHTDIHSFRAEATTELTSLCLHSPLLCSPTSCGCLWRWPAVPSPSSPCSSSLAPSSHPSWSNTYAEARRIIMYISISNN